MRMIRAAALMVIVMASIGVVTAQSSRQAEAQLKAAQMLEDVERDLPAAMEAYTKLAASSDRRVAAQALLRLAGCFEKLGSPEARTVYERIIAEFPKEEAITALARARLATQPTGGAPREFTRAPIDTRLDIFWKPSPDGRLAAEATGAGPGLIVHDLVARTHRLLVENESAQQARVRSFEVWSPDSKRGVYVWLRTGLPPSGRAQSIELRVIDLATGEWKTIASRPGGVGADFRATGAVGVRAWTTGDEVVFTVGQREVFFMPSSGGTTTSLTLPESTNFGDITPDGAALLLIGDERLITLDRATRRTQILTQGFPVSTPRVSPDGKLVAYFAKQSTKWTLRVAALTPAPIARSVEIAEVPPVDSIFNGFIRWSRDGRLTFDARVTADSLYGVRLDAGRARPDARIERLVHESWSAGNPIISPDNRLVAYATGRGLAVMNADGSGERDLVEGAVPLGWLSPDEIVFSTSVDEGLAAVSLRTGTIRSIGHDAPVNADVAPGAPQRDAFQYLPFRNDILFRRFVGQQLATFVLRRSGGEERELLQIPVSRPAELSRWSLSPAGDRFAYAKFPGAEVAAAEGRPLYLRTIGKDDEKLVTQLAGAMSWSSDGRTLLFTPFNPTGYELRALDVETGESLPVLDAQHLANVFAPDSEWSIRACSLATDRSFVVCGVFETTTQRHAWSGVTYEAVTARLRR